MIPAQVKEARRLLGWSLDRLGAESKTGPSAIRILEETGRVPQAKAKAARGDRMEAIRTALEVAGVEFTNGDAPGVRLRKPSP